MNIFITGSTGYLGKKLIDKFIEYFTKNKSCKLFLLIRSPEKIPEYWRKHENIIFISGEINNFSIPQNITINVMIHLASYNKNDDIEQLYKTNIEGSEHVCEIVKSNNIPKLIYLSSVSVLNGKKLNSKKKIYKNDFNYSAKDEYGKSKIEAEKIIMSYKDINKIILRSAYLYDDDKYFGTIKKRMQSLKYRIVVSEKNCVWHIAHSDLVINLILGLAFNNTALKNDANTIVKIVADKKNISVKSLYAEIAQNMNLKAPLFLNPFFFKTANTLNGIIKLFLPNNIKQKFDIKNNIIAYHYSPEIYEIDQDWINNNLL
ncbi:NAD(P)-dependent oxidoreductase [Candidatus Dependentiae bacterium]|nr:NAD(P)-dependent oxidoreductase [Candidatus Dependentiae bacterium]